jgi:hypothetical protein
MASNLYMTTAVCAESSHHHGQTLSLTSGPRRAAMGMSLRDAVEATLVGRDERLVARCDVEGILSALDLYGIFDVDDLAANLETSFGALQTPRQQRATVFPGPAQGSLARAGDTGYA